MCLSFRVYRVQDFSFAVQGSGVWSRSHSLGCQVRVSWFIGV